MELITDAKDPRLHTAIVLLKSVTDLAIEAGVFQLSLASALTRAEEAEGKLCRAREILQRVEAWFVPGDRVRPEMLDEIRHVIYVSSPCRHAAIAERVEDTEGMARFLYEIETGKNWYDLSEKGKTLWEEPAAAILKYLEGK